MLKRAFVFSALLCLFSPFIFAQITFEPGYYLSNNGVIHEGFIKNVDWKNNPSGIEFRANLEGESANIALEDLLAFEIIGISKYVKRTVQIDQSTDNVRTLTASMIPEFETETVLLKVIVEGRLSLYYYERSNMRRFFIEGLNKSIEQLIYKRYKISFREVEHNNEFQFQLKELLYCGNIPDDRYFDLSYTRKDLSNIVIDLNSCIGSEFTAYSKLKEKKNLFAINLRGGFYVGQVDIYQSLYSWSNAEFDSQINEMFGAELEYYLPFQNQKWAATLELTYKKFTGFQDFGYDAVNFTYNTLELPVGLRYYMYLNDDIRVFLNPTVTLSVLSDTRLEFDTRNNVDDSRAAPYISIGTGISLYEKFAFEMRVGINQEIMATNTSWDSDYYNFVFAFSYRLPISF